MTNWNSLVLGADLSHYQKRPDYGKLEADGVQYVIIKATQKNHVDPDFDWNRNEAARRGKMWLPYPFLEPGDNTDVIQHFVTVVGKGVNVPVALDWEAAGTSAQVVEAWMDSCAEAFGRPGINYYGLYPPTPITQRICEWPHWFPEYPTNPNADPRLSPWDGTSEVTDWSTEWLIWQYTGAGRLPGVSTAIDLNRLACSLDIFKRWYDTGFFEPNPHPPVPAPSPKLALPLVPTDQLPLHMHSFGKAVWLMQRRLAALLYQIGVDGSFGPQTAGVVKDFQSDNGLLATAIADRPTIDKLNSF